MDSDVEAGWRLGRNIGYGGARVWRKREAPVWAARFEMCTWTINNIEKLVTGENMVGGFETYRSFGWSTGR